MANLTKKQKEALAAALISKAGDLIEFWSEQIENDPNREVLETIDADQAARQLAIWLQRLPGDSWSTMLPEIWAEEKS